MENDLVKAWKTTVHDTCIRSVFVYEEYVRYITAYLGSLHCSFVEENIYTRIDCKTLFKLWTYKTKKN